MELLLILGITVAVFAYIGRTSIPASERLPLSSWRVSDVARNAWLGLIVCAVQTPLDRTMEETFRPSRQ
ncbi:hypothetical protein ASH00_06345 [Arthrobacter sp. Soil782]|uniref:hypothetical protein n=1 Tax=Arthrobacter sp. Soil782 TaxID=1736410 RepID=UPI0006F99DA6|nr:hypothetical protein [Arthrobacter sp. Soil782]KRF09250.1 hypothetical protein ASH00_06345 [Arthrobacter sp. Soil782]